MFKESTSPAILKQTQIKSNQYDFQFSIVDNILSDKVDGEVHPSLNTLGHDGIFEVASVEKAVITGGLKFFKKGLTKGKILFDDDDSSIDDADADAAADDDDDDDDGDGEDDDNDRFNNLAC